MRKILSLFLIAISFSATSCKDVLEEDISGDTVQVLAPLEGMTIEGNTVQFSWQGLDGADEYRVQVMNQNSSVLVDSLVESTWLDYNLNPGDYQWRIKGENFAYSTEFNFPIHFNVVPLEDLTSQLVQLLTPSDDFYTNDPSNLMLNWNGIVTAEYYNLEIVKELNGQETVLQETNITSTNFALPDGVMDEDAEYLWKVKALNTTSETAYSQRSIFVDTQAPSQPSLVLPEDEEAFTDPQVTFNWTNGIDTGNVQSAITNTIVISTDNNFTTILHEADTENNSYQYTFDTTGDFYWKVKATDAASNQSDYSTVRTITVEE